MKIILSRKGFDSSSGGCPSPILPDGTLLSLPIPDKRSRIKYSDVQHKGHSFGKIVQNITNGKIGAQAKAHLDPDLIQSAYPREKGWRPVLGQTGSAQGHLSKQGIEAGDVFVFFGLFREIEKHKNKWRFIPGTKPRHMIWGWMQVGEIVAIDQLKEQQLSWARYHPHFHGQEDKNNTLYIASQDLTLGRSTLKGRGAGTFDKVDSTLTLTHPHSDKPSYWRLPKWFYPDGDKTPLSFHHNVERWSLSQKKDACLLQSVARGQEFVLDSNEYPESMHWIADYIKSLK